MNREVRHNPSRAVFIAATLAVAVSLGATAQTQAQTEAPASAQLEVRPGDYAKARVAFHTHLVVDSASPQRFAPVTPPAGVTEVEYSSGALRLKAWVGKPATTLPKMPVVIFLHGGFAFGADDFEMTEPYRAAGFVVVTPMLRGENGQRGAFSMFYNEVDDVLAITAFVKSQPYVDTGHIYLAGHSVGGTMAMLTGMTSSDFKAVASFSGSPDQFAWTSAPHGTGLCRLTVRTSTNWRCGLPLPTPRVSRRRHGYISGPKKRSSA